MYHELNDSNIHKCYESNVLQQLHFKPNVFAADFAVGQFHSKGFKVLWISLYVIALYV